MELSILIPARNEMFLAKTVENILENIEGDTEIIVVADGNWPNPPVKDDPRVRMIYHSKSIGQRAATNEAARLSRAKFIMKADAHCAFAKGFDVVLMTDCGYMDTMIPRMYNLHAFDWVCSCGNRQYQGPTPEKCGKCGGKMEREILWERRPHTSNDFMRFDSDLHFQYWLEYKERVNRKDKIVETMSLLGACWFLHRERYWDIEGMDEATGSWGQMGTEIACKSWLSGGRLVTNRKTWFAHMFRTSGGDFGFPYPNPGIRTARKRSQHLWLGNNWYKQIHPLSWLIDRFWPIPGWSDNSRTDISKTGASFINLRNKSERVLSIVTSVPSPMADHTSPVPSDGFRQEMPILTMGLSELSGGSPITQKNISSIGNKSQMEGIATSPISTNMVHDRNISSLTVGDGSDKHGVDKSVSDVKDFINPDLPISISSTTSPNPTGGVVINSNLGKETDKGFAGDFHNTKVPKKELVVKGLVYYTDNRPNPQILTQVQKQILKCANGHPIVSVSLKPLNFGNNITLPLERGYLTMFKQILAGIEACDAEVIFLVEHDVLYHPSHFEFTPPRKDVFYYDENRWFVDANDGKALFYNAKSTSMLCAYRELLLEHYRKRVERVEKEGFSYRLGFEPGNHPFPRGVDNYTSEAWMAPFPSIDIRHEKNLTITRWTKDGFRNKQNLYAWTEAEEVPGWGRTKGRFQEILNAV